MLEHECFKEVNKKLAEFNTEIESNLFRKDQIFISTILSEKHRGIRPKRLIASHCPFCGKKLS
jgi:hypothetical protein